MQEDTQEQVSVRAAAGDLAGKQRLQHIRFCAAALVHGAALIVVVTLNQIGWWPGIYQDLLGSKEWLFCFCVMLMVSGMLADISPGTWTLRRADVAHVLAMAYLSWRASSAKDAFHLVALKTTFTTVRFGLSVAFGNTCITAVLNVAYSGIIIWQYVTQVPATARFLEVFGETITLDWWLWQELIILVIILVNSYNVETRRTAEACAVAEDRSMRRERSATRALLNTMCDVVVELDTSMSIVGHASKLACLLLHGSGRSLQGTNLQEQLATAEDQEKLAARLGTAGAGPAGAGVGPEVWEAMVTPFHVQMRDSLSNTISMEFFPVRFEGVDSRPRHLIGIREVSDSPAPAPSSLRPDGLAPHELTDDVTEAMRRVSVLRDELGLRNELRFVGEARPDLRGPVPNGTPSVSHWATLSSGSGRSSTSRSSSCSGGDLALARYGPTRESAKHITLLQLIQTWNTAAPRTSCCTFHAALGEVRSVLKMLRRVQCLAGYTPMGGWQCPYCGLLSEEPLHFDESIGRCEMCASWSEAPRPRPRERRLPRNPRFLRL